MTLDFDFKCKQQQKLNKYKDPVNFLTTIKKNIEIDDEYGIININDGTCKNQWYIDENYNELKNLIKERLKESKTINIIDNFLINVDKYLEIIPEEILEVRNIGENIKLIYKKVNDYEIRYYYRISERKIVDVYCFVDVGYTKESICVSSLLEKIDCDKLTEQLFKNASGRLKALL